MIEHKRELQDSFINEINIEHSFDEKAKELKLEYCRLLKVGNINIEDLLRLLEEKKYIKQYELLKVMFDLRVLYQSKKDYIKTLV